MSTLLITHPACLDHHTPSGHPESVQRLMVIEKALSDSFFAPLVREVAPLATLDDLKLAHEASYIEALYTVSGTVEDVWLDGDTVISPGSWEAALRGAGAAILGVDKVLKEEMQNVFCSIRPPGHHAEKAQGMGFCLVNHTAIAALHALERHGLERVAIIDWDVHHGNGTQDIVWNDPRLFYASTHQMPLFPGTGFPFETGAHHNVLNIPLGEGDGSEAFRDAFTRSILPAIENFRPKLIILSAGFDAHHDDPLGGLMLDEKDFGWATRTVMDAAQKLCVGRIVSLLEGGYDLNALALSVSAHVQALMKHDQG
jgi:acetoin utilization deacetylase AcuC-like enzyme